MTLPKPQPLIPALFRRPILPAVPLAFALALFLALLPTPARAEWREATSEHFVVVSDGSERQLAQLSQRLEAVHWMMTLLTGVTPSTETQRVRIYYVESISDVHRAIGESSNSDIAGFYRTDMTGPIAGVPRSEGNFSTTILFHEYAHHFMLQYLPVAYPHWFVEGYAEFVSTASFEREGTITIGRVANQRQAELEQVRWVPVPQLFAPPAEGERRQSASYGQYWLLAHYLLMTDHRRQQLNRYITAINRGMSHDMAVQLFTGGLEQLDRDARAYLSRRNFTYRLAPLPEGVMASPTVRTLRPGEAAAIPFELQVTRRMDENERAALARQLAAAVARFPDDITLSLLDARLRFDMADWAGAQAAAERVLANEPDNSRALAWRGWAWFSAAHAEGRTPSVAEASRMRATLLAARQAAPLDTVASLAYFNSFALAGQRPPAAASAALIAAADASPQDDDLRIKAAVEQALGGQLREAASRLTVLANAPHASPARAHARLLLEWIADGANGAPPDPPADDDDPDD